MEWRAYILLLNEQQLANLLAKPNSDRNPEFTLLQRMADYELRERERKRLRAVKVENDRQRNTSPDRGAEAH